MEIQAYAMMERGAFGTPFAFASRRGIVLVRITHRSMPIGDVQFIDNAWGDTRYPLVPRHELVGLVEQLGDEVTELQRSDRVGVGFS